MSTSRSLNKVLLIGNLTRNPVIRQTTNGSVVCSFGVATNSTWKDSKGNLQERTEFHNVIAWNKLGEICAQILSTGMLVFIEGELRTRNWEDSNGTKHFKTEIKLEDMKLLDDKGKKGIGVDEAKKTGEQMSKEEFVDEDVIGEKPATVANPVVEEAVKEDSQKEEVVTQSAEVKVEDEEKKEEKEEGDDLF